MKIFLLFLLLTAGFSLHAQTGKPVSNEKETPVKVLKFYPNPAVSVINFEFQKPVDKGFTLQIYNFIGKKMSELPALSSKVSVALDEYFRGVYIFQLRDRTGRIVETGKFQVAR